MGLIISLRDTEELSREQIDASLKADAEIRFEGQNRKGVYEWITRTLRNQKHREQGKPMRGLIRRYLEKWTGLSWAQVSRLVGKYLEHSEVKEVEYRRNRFASRFTKGDIELLAKVDEAHETLSGPATKRILSREWEQYRKSQYNQGSRK